MCHHIFPAQKNIKPVTPKQALDMVGLHVTYLTHIEVKKLVMNYPRKGEVIEARGRNIRVGENWLWLGEIAEMQIVDNEKNA